MFLIHPLGQARFGFFPSFLCLEKALVRLQMSVFLTILHYFTEVMNLCLH